MRDGRGLPRRRRLRPIRRGLGLRHRLRRRRRLTLRRRWWLYCRKRLELGNGGRVILRWRRQRVRQARLRSRRRWRRRRRDILLTRRQRRCIGLRRRLARGLSRLDWRRRSGRRRRLGLDVRRLDRRLVSRRCLRHLGRWRLPSIAVCRPRCRHGRRVTGIRSPRRDLFHEHRDCRLVRPGAAAGKQCQGARDQSPMHQKGAHHAAGPRPRGRFSSPSRQLRLTIGNVIMYRHISA